MKRSIILLSTVIGYFLLCAVSCDDDTPHITVKGIEEQIYKEIQTFRDTNGQTGTFTHQWNVMVKEAQLFSAKMAGESNVDTTGIADVWATIHELLGGSNELTLLQQTTSTTAAEIAANWTNDSTASSLLLGNYTMCGVGVEYDTEQVAYVTLLLMLY